jgi:hypothetical protein
LAGKGSFYEKFGFFSEDYTRYIKEKMNRPITDLLDDDQIDHTGLGRESTVTQLAQFILENCSSTSSMKDTAKELADSFDTYYQNRNYFFVAKSESPDPSVKDIPSLWLTEDRSPADATASMDESDAMDESMSPREEEEIERITSHLKAYVKSYLKDHPRDSQEDALRHFRENGGRDGYARDKSVQRLVLLSLARFQNARTGGVKGGRFILRKNRNRSTYKVMNAVTGKVYARSTTKKKAKAQLRLLRSIGY